jgi:mannitol-1-phosphate/altronate dehydrogenase
MKKPEKFNKHVVGAPTLNVDYVDYLEKKIALAESVIDKITPSDSNQRQMISSYKKFTQCLNKS